MKKKKILFTSHTANFQKFNRPFMRWFREQGWEVHYASMGEETIQDCDKSFAIPFTRNPFKINNIRAYSMLKKIIDQKQYDIIHTHTPVGGVVTRLAARKNRKKGARVIYTAHGFHFFKGAPFMNWLIYYPIERYMARHTDTLITINVEDFKKAKSFKSNTVYIPGVGVDPSKFSTPMPQAVKQTLRNSLGLTNSDFVMIYPAELNKNKNQKMLIDIMADVVVKHPDIYLLLPGLDSMNGYHQKYINKKNIVNNVRLLGYRSDIPELLKISDIAVSASQREGLPVNIMEAMFANLPIIATDCRGIRNLVEQSKNGFLVSPHDTGEFEEKIILLYSRNSMRNKLGSVSRNMVEEYDIKNILTRMSSIYSINSSTDRTPQ